MRINLIYMVTFVTIMFFSCKEGVKEFKIEGKIESAENEMLYLEHRGLSGIELLDSTKLSASGDFSFKSKAPQNPEFYQLRIKNTPAIFTVDSTETLTVKADANNFANSLNVANSEANDQIKYINQLTSDIVLQIANMEKQYKLGQLDDAAYTTQLDSVLSNYKKEASKLILSNPASAVAYYTVFQKVNNDLIFNPYNKEDCAMYGAVATSWSSYYPETERTKHLYDFAINAIKTRKQNNHLLQNIEVIEKINISDIALPDKDGKKVALSSLKGKLVLLDFTVYKAEYSPEYNMKLNKVYSSLKASGLEIYQVSLDSDEHFWKNASINIPWIAVREKNNTQSNLLTKLYVKKVPTAFIVDRNGDIVSRVEDFSKLESDIRKYLSAK